MEPYYDPALNRIVGAKKGTWAYAHELRHQWQFTRFPNLEEIITKVHIRCYYASIIASIVLTIVLGWQGIIIGVGFGMLAHVLLTALMEADAYVNGTIYYLQKKTELEK